ncbi:MAG TPA: hypothetical protein VFJ14_04190 [Nocardioidaceae bacterium]|nr:hypothetical protein [Nocardioidaceae bacterium]
MHDPDEWELPLTGHTSSLQGIPGDAQLMGLDRNTEEGALVAMAGSMNRNKRSHRVVAWVAIVALAAPVLFSALALLL